jgi:hypothetical protein
MKLLLNNKEIAHFLLSLIDYYKSVKDIEMPGDEVNEAITYIVIEKNKKKFDLLRMQKKFKDRIESAVSRDLKNYKMEVQKVLKAKREQYYELVHGNIDYFIDTLGEENILNLYKNNAKQNFVKSVGLKIDPSGILIRRRHFTDYSDDCLIRNTVGNEKLLLEKIDKKYPFWFIDSGYTNFIEPNKKWHRIVRNHLHNNAQFAAPVDRLGNFTKFPRQWRDGGDKILIIEPGPFAAGIFKVDLSTWRYNVEAELRQYSDKPIVFREKINKKTRSNLYEELCNDDFYCVININSNAATEAIWAGIPVITLDKHITNSVSRNKISDINNLYRPNLANWLCMLSYSQFTYDELISGTALTIYNQYHV